MAGVLMVRNEYRSKTWAMLIQGCNNSWLTKQEFCQQRGISERSFYYWLRSLMAEAVRPSGTVGSRSRPDGYAADPVPGCGTENAGRCRH